MRTKPVATLSLDLDNLWAYQMTHGDPGWDGYASYVERFVPLALELLADKGVRATFFIVGRDASLEHNHDALQAIARAGHEVGNHSFDHRPWLHRGGDDEIFDELRRTHDAVEAATGVAPEGFRGPGYSLSVGVLRALLRLGYRYDASTLPTFIGPLARRYYFRQAKLSASQRADRQELFGHWREGLRPLKPYRWVVDGDEMLEIPVTTLPVLRTPMHPSYLLTLAGIRPALGRSYFAAGLAACRVGGVSPSVLLHPLDLLGADDVHELGFFPAMDQTGHDKRAHLGRFLDQLTARFDVVPMGEHAAQLRWRAALPVRPATEAGPPGPGLRAAVGRR